MNNKLFDIKQKREKKTKLYTRMPCDSMADAMATVSPNKQYLGMRVPTIPATTAPENKINITNSWTVYVY